MNARSDADFGTEVYDEAELAEIDERAFREAEINSIRSQVFQGTTEEAEALIDPNKECAECGCIIPVARQRALPSAIYCVDCQQWHDEEKQRRRKLSGSTPIGWLGQ